MWPAPNLSPGNAPNGRTAWFAYCGSKNLVTLMDLMGPIQDNHLKNCRITVHEECWLFAQTSKMSVHLSPCNELSEANKRMKFRFKITSWWFQPIWKILIISPGRGEHKKKWNHHLENLSWQLVQFGHVLPLHLRLHPSLHPVTDSGFFQRQKHLGNPTGAGSNRNKKHTWDWLISGCPYVLGSSFFFAREQIGYHKFP